jgi:Skp family chaperone for outer membrane proteins
MKKRIPALVLVMSLALAGCNKDAEVNTILGTIDSFTTELVRCVETSPNPNTGVDDAQKYFDSRKADLAARMETLKGLRAYQVSDETKGRVASSLVDDASKVGDLQIKYVNQSMSDPAFKAKLDKLVKDHQALLTQ